MYCWPVATGGLQKPVFGIKIDIYVNVPTVQNHLTIFSMLLEKL